MPLNDRNRTAESYPRMSTTGSSLPPRLQATAQTSALFENR